MEFHTPSMEDQKWVQACLSAAPRQACDYNFVNILGWSKAYGVKIAHWNGFLLTKLKGLGGSYLWPVGAGEEKAVLEDLADDAGKEGLPLRLAAVPAQDAEKLEAWFPGQFLITPNRDGFDYCYDIEKMVTLAGKKLHGKRNHINRFLETQEGKWSFAPMTPDQLEECLEMSAQWNRLNRQEEDSPSGEDWALRSAADHFEALHMDGGVLRVYGEVVAFTMGSLLTPEIYNVNFEKAYGELQGAYPMIAREFARMIHEKYPKVRYLNREDDLGLEGLRKAKESYYPDLMVEKYTAIAQ